MVSLHYFTRGTPPSLFGGDAIMRCLSCNCNLSDREANRKYENWEEIKNPESRYIGLCNDCLMDTDLIFVENDQLSGEIPEEDSPQLEFDLHEYSDEWESR